MTFIKRLLPALFCAAFATAAFAADDYTTCQAESGDVALVACNRAINSGRFNSKQMAFLYVWRGAEWRGKNEDDKALADFTAAIKLDPTIPAIYNNRANIYRDRGELDRAIADFTTAIRLDPLYTAAFTNRGKAYEAQKAFDKAREDYRAALSVPPKHNDGAWAQKYATERLEALKGQ